MEDARRITNPSEPNGRPHGVKQKTALLICYEFGPHDHTGGLRWRAIERDLTDWHFDVIASRPPLPEGTVIPENLHRVDQRTLLRRLREALVKDRSQEVLGEIDSIKSIHPDKVLLPVKKLRTKDQIRNLLNGGANLLENYIWVRRALTVARRLTTESSYDVVISTSPMELTHLVAATISREKNIPYLADFRDPLFYGRGPDIHRIDPLARFFWRRLEEKTIAQAVAITDIAEGAQRSTQKELNEAAPEIARIPRFYISNGYDPLPAGRPSREKFIISYTGWIWPFMPLPAFLKACGSFLRENPDKGKKVIIDLTGSGSSFNGVQIGAIARGAGIGNHINITPRVSCAEIEEKQRKSAVGVCFDSVTATAICIPSKLYHYSRFCGRILPIGATDGAMAEEAAKIGVPTFDPQNQAGIVEFLTETYQLWKQDKLTIPADPDGLFANQRRSTEMGVLLDQISAGKFPMKAKQSPKKARA